MEVSPNFYPSLDATSGGEEGGFTTGQVELWGRLEERWFWAEFLGSELSERERIACIWRQVGSLHDLLSVAYTLDWWPSANNYFVFESESFPSNSS